jgi:hypothetical protein
MRCHPADKKSAAQQIIPRIVKKRSFLTIR